MKEFNIYLPVLFVLIFTSLSEASTTVTSRHTSTAMGVSTAPEVTFVSSNTSVEVTTAYMQTVNTTTMNLASNTTSIMNSTMNLDGNQSTEIGWNSTTDRATTIPGFFNLSMLEPLVPFTESSLITNTTETEDNYTAIAANNYTTVTSKDDITILTNTTSEMTTHESVVHTSSAYDANITTIASNISETDSTAASVNFTTTQSKPKPTDEDKTDLAVMLAPPLAIIGVVGLAILIVVLVFVFKDSLPSNNKVGNSVVSIRGGNDMDIESVTSGLVRDTADILPTVD